MEILLLLVLLLKHQYKLLLLYNKHKLLKVHQYNNQQNKLLQLLHKMFKHKLQLKLSKLLYNTKYKLKHQYNIKLLHKHLRLTTTTMYNVLTQLQYNEELTATLQHKNKLLK